MQTGPKIAIGVTVVMLLAVGVRVGLIYRANHEAAQVKAPAEQAVDPDMLVFLRKMHPDSVADQRALIGTTIWIAAGDQLDDYVDTGKHADFSKHVATLRATEPLVVREVFEQKAPTTGRATSRIPLGDRQVLLGFTLPHAADPKQLYAMPVGYHDTDGYTFYDDDMFYYDDPHTLYKQWGPQVWQHIDKHEAAVGMTENQVGMALGTIAQPSSDSAGNRSITYANLGHTVTVEFEGGKAVKVTPGS